MPRVSNKMVLNRSPVNSPDQKLVYDEIYREAWAEALAEQRRKLEECDCVDVESVKTIDDFRTKLEMLLKEHPDDAPAKAIKLIRPTLDHYHVFAENFVAMMSKPVDVSMMWGLLYLVFSLALRIPGPVQHLRNVTDWLEKICEQLRVSNDCRHLIPDKEKVTKDTLEVNKKLVILWLDVIMEFRRVKGTDEDSSSDTEAREDRDPWKYLWDIYTKAYDNISEAIRRIENVANTAEKQASRMLTQTLINQVESMRIERIHEEGVTLPCDTLPVAENRSFFGRQDILDQIDKHLSSSTVESSGLPSIALWGLGGIGKTQTALAYAYKKLDQLDAVFWIPAEDRLSMQQGFSRAATDALHLPNAHPQTPQENMFRVFKWLSKTSARWLIVFDNVDDHRIFDEYWPVSQHGAVLVTTRDSLIAALPIDRGLEVTEFDVEDGSRFLLHMASSRKPVEDEGKFARQVAQDFGGLPLALNQMAALINYKGMSIESFCVMYGKHQRRLHTQKKNGFKYVGYSHGLDTVWELSFTSLSDEAMACLGILSFLSADSIPGEIFIAEEPGALPHILSFCEDDLAFDDMIEELIHHGLVRRNIEEGTFRIHRLVQFEYRARMDNPQDKFDAAVQLLLGKFPSERSNQYDDEEWILYERYIPQVLALNRHYNDSQKKKSAEALQATMKFVLLLVNAANAVHDNDTTNVVHVFLETASAAYKQVPVEDQDELLWAFLQSLNCMYHFCTSEFQKAEQEMREGLNIRLKLLPPDDLLIALAYSWLAMAVGAQGRYEEGLDFLLSAGKILEGPAGEIPTRRLIWGYNTSRNYYCMRRYSEAERLLTEALDDANRMQSWYMQVYGHLTFVSLRTRMGLLDDAKTHVDTAKHILESSSIAARFSWLSSYCAYRAGDVAARQDRLGDAISEHEKAVAIGKLTKVPPGILCRCIHALSNALAKDPDRAAEAERQRLEARRIRSQLPAGGGDLDDETDEAFENLVKMDHR